MNNGPVSRFICSLELFPAVHSECLGRVSLVCGEMFHFHQTLPSLKLLAKTPANLMLGRRNLLSVCKNWPMFSCFGQQELR